MHGAFVDLLAGNARHAEAYDRAFDDLQDGQDPPTVTVCCSDSRVLAHHMWDNDEPGMVFSCENIGNRVVQRTEAGDVISGDVAYPVVVADAAVVAVVGHTGCGAVTATYEALTDEVEGPPGVVHCVDLLATRLADGVERLPDDLDRATNVDHLVEYNVDCQVDALLDADEVPDDVQVVGAVYDFQDTYDGRRGEVHVVNVDGERDPARLRDAHPEVADRVARLWEY
jgi:carbonic anhydrase